MYGLKREEIRRHCGKLHNKKIRNPYLSLNIIKAIKRRTTRTELAALMAEIGNAYEILVRKPSANTICKTTPYGRVIRKMFETNTLGRCWLYFSGSEEGARVHGEDFRSRTGRKHPDHLTCYKLYQEKPCSRQLHYRLRNLHQYWMRACCRMQKKIAEVLLRPHPMGCGINQFTVSLTGGSTGGNDISRC